MEWPISRVPRINSAVNSLRKSPHRVIASAPARAIWWVHIREEKWRKVPYWSQNCLISPFSDNMQITNLIKVCCLSESRLKASEIELRTSQNYTQNTPFNNENNPKSDEICSKVAQISKNWKKNKKAPLCYSCFPLRIQAVKLWLCERRTLTKNSSEKWTHLANLMSTSNNFKSQTRPNRLIKLEMT